MATVILGLVCAALAGLLVWLVATRRAPTQANGDGGEALARVAGELQLINQRIDTIERNDRAVQDGIQRLDMNLAKTGTETTGLKQAAESIRGELTQARASLASLQSAAAARQDQERRTADSLRRLEAVIAGTSSKGAAGENIVDTVFAKLPPEWQVRDYRMGNRTVEFGLRLPNGLVLPIDSKWPATNLIEQFHATDDAAEQARLKAQIERAVEAKAAEVCKYLDPELTAGFAVAVIPDAVYELCTDAPVRAFQMNVVLVGYSMFVPYLLLVFQTVLKHAQEIDVEKLATYLDTAERSLRTIEEELEGRHARGLTMLQNSRDDMRGQLSHAQTSLASIRIRTHVEELGSEKPAPALTREPGLFD